MIDDVFFKGDRKMIEDRRRNVADWVMEVLNEGRQVTESDLAVKVMLLSKVKKEIVNSLQDIRTISISNVHIKILELSLKHLSKDILGNYQGPSQVAFKKGIGDTELMVIKAIELSQKYDTCIKYDIANAYDSVHKNLIR